MNPTEYIRLHVSHQLVFFQTVEYSCVFWLKPHLKASVIYEGRM